MEFMPMKKHGARTLEALSKAVLPFTAFAGLLAFGLFLGGYPGAAIASGWFGGDRTILGAPARLEPLIASEALPEWVYTDPLALRLSLQTAVYDLSAHVVVMPDGARLEAHSGLRDRADDPRFVREHMRGSTPPALYDLALRKGSFHGVAALRLEPVAGNIFGRSGLLAHPYMLRGRPESNGCVVFRDYAAFLKAFREGRIKRLRVTPSIGEAALHIASEIGGGASLSRRAASFL